MSAEPDSPPTVEKRTVALALLPTFEKIEALWFELEDVTPETLQDKMRAGEVLEVAANAVVSFPEAQECLLIHFADHAGYT